MRPRQIRAETRAGGARPPDGYRLRFALELDGLEGLVFELRLRRSVRLLSDRNAADRGDALEARGGVHDVAGHDALAGLGARPERHHGLTGRDADADLQPEAWIGLVHLFDRFDRAQGAPHRPLGVVFVGDRSPIHGHDGVADEFLDRPAVALDLLANPRVVGPQARANVLRIGLVGRGREVDEVAEQHRDDLPLLGQHVRQSSLRDGTRPARRRRCGASARPP